MEHRILTFLSSYFLVLCFLHLPTTSSTSRVKRQFGFSIGLPGGNNDNNGRQDVLGSVISGLFGGNNNQPNKGGTVVNPFDIINNIVGGGGRPPNNQNNNPNNNNGSNIIGTINLGNIPIHLTNGQNGGLGINIGSNTCGQQNRGCEQGCRLVRRRPRCFCNQGYFLNRDRRTCSDVNECQNGNGGCIMQCNNTPGSFACSCSPGLILMADGRSCGNPGTNNQESCSGNNGGCTQGCSQNNFGVTCFCQQGFNLGPDQKSCLQVDLCAQGNGGCHQGCSSTPQGVRCSCNQGFVLQSDQRSCAQATTSSPSPSCRFNNGGCQHFCRDFSNGRRCFCQRGYQLQSDGTTCSQPTSNNVQACHVNNGGCGQICNQNIFGATCSCQPGYVLSNGKSCNDIDECQQNNGGCEHKCANSAGSFSCSCNPGFSLVNGRCTGQTVTPAPQKKGCGRNNKKSLFNRIVGGQIADPKDWPWMAALLKTTGDVQYCGGSLITDRHVLTAAHCLKPFSASQIKVRLGEYNFDTFNDNNPTDFNVVDVRLHERYDTKTQENDIAILKLDKSTSFSEFIQPICLPDPGDNYEGKMGYVTGWGTIHFGGPVATTLQEVVVPVWAQRECENAYPGKVSSSMMCAGIKTGGKDSCQGDSGGPYQTQSIRTKRWHLAGVVSWGIECASANRPGVYTRVNHYLSWIKSNAIFP